VSRPASLRSPARPLLAVVHSDRSVPPLTVFAAATGLCDLVWVVDAVREGNAADLPLLRRLGRVVDAPGLAPGPAVAALGPLEPAGIVVFSDEHLVAAALIAQRLGLRFHSPAVAVALTDKEVQRTILADAGMEGPRLVAIPADATPGRWRAAGRSLGYPLVVKPRAGSTSWDTVLAPDEAALVDCARWASGKEMVAEQYLPDAKVQSHPGIAGYLSVETAVTGAGYRHLATTGRLPLAPDFRETGFFIPAALDADTRAAVLATADKAASALGVATGIFRTEVKLTPDGPRVIEVNGRLGGAVADAMLLAGGPSFHELVLRLALGLDLPGDGPLPCDRIGFRLLYQPPRCATGVESIEGLDRVATLPGVTGVALHHRPGDALDWRRQGTDTYLFTVNGAVADHGALVAVHRAVTEAVTVGYRHD